jgi:competence CoiA-like predicted nuclease
MPFIAKSIKTGRRFDISEVEKPHELDKNDIICPLCSEVMIVRAGPIRVHHFAHKSLCSSNYNSQPESQEHLLAKRYLSKEISNIWSEYSTARIELEYIIEECKRVADIAVIFPTGWIVAHEIQLSPITINELNERTKDYLSASVDVVWWLGNQADTESNRQWCLQNFGFCNSLDFIETQADPKTIFGKH